MTLSAVHKALLDFVQGVEGKAWADDREGWTMYDIDVCGWDGIKCSPGDMETVVGIMLGNSHFMGTIPNSLGTLVHLKKIDLSQNLMTGIIPSHIQALPHLDHVDLSGNQLHGVMPIFDSKVLKFLNLQNNILSSSIPRDFGGRHASLEYLDLSMNNLHGTIPDTFSQMAKLDVLSLAQNKLFGTIPADLFLGNIKTLRLQSNDLVGMIPNEVGDAKHITELRLEDNALSGTVPSDLTDIKTLSTIHITGNKFTGSVPSELCHDGGLNLKTTRSKNDDCSHLSCETGTYSGKDKCHQCAGDTFNPYVGQETCFDVDEFKILLKIYTSLGGVGWTQETVGWGGSNVNICKYTGVTCDNGKVKRLLLSNMGLKGRIPSEIGFLKILEELDLSDNMITGPVPSDLRYAPLEKLDLSGNQCVGSIPPLLCLKPEINGNGKKGKYKCETVACPLRTYSESGFAPPGKDCEPCSFAEFLGSKECNIPGLGNAAMRAKNGNGWQVFGDLVFSFLVMGGMAYGIHKLYHKVKRGDYEKAKLVSGGVATIDLSDEVEFS